MRTTVVYKLLPGILLITIWIMHSPLLKADTPTPDEEKTDISPPDKTEEITRLHAKGVALFEGRKYAEAAQVYKEIISLDSDSEYHYYLGECEYRQKRYDKAFEAFYTFLKNAGEQATSETRSHAEDMLMEVAPFISKITLAETDSFEVWVDDEYRGNTPLDAPIALIAGKHKVVLKKNGEEIYTTKQSLEAGEIVSLRRPETKAVASNASTEANTRNALDNNRLMLDTPPFKQSPLKISGTIAATVGAALLISGGITGRLARIKGEQLSDNCPDKNNCDQSYEHYKTDAEALIKATNALLVLGAITTISGVALVIIGHKKHFAREKLALTSVPIVGKTMMGISVTGEF